MQMELAQKKRIIKRYLEQISNTETVIPEEDIEGVPFFIEIGNALDALEQYHGQFIDFQNVELDEIKWGNLSDILGEGLTFTVGSPSVVTAVQVQDMGQRAVALEDLEIINGLPQPDYYNRITSLNDDVQLNTVAPFIIPCRTKLAALLEDITEDTEFDPANNTKVENLIKRLTTQKEQAEKDSNDDEVERLDKYLTVAEDLLKVNKLDAISIPNEQGGNDIYCTLAESAGGVTEKVSLVSIASVTTQLQRLQHDAIDSLDDYITNRQNYKLRTEGILKLPKHGDIKEVQREAMALNVSEILGEDTTRSCFVTHEGKPALFVPFDDIKLLKEFAKGITFKAFGSSKTYEHYSTINPVGAGIQGNQYIEDFGHSFGLFYLCSDTDSIGGYNQNKALRNNRSLYIFDQVIMSSDKMKLDSRLSLQPDEFIMKHTRHGQGRNRTLIEDSPIPNKFDSLFDLIDKQTIIKRYATATAERHQREILRLNEQLSNHGLSSNEKKAFEKQKKEVTELRDDAVLIEKAMDKRIKKIYDVLPESIERNEHPVTRDHVKHAFILEKLLHNPTLFTEDGRPYRNPWTYRHKTSIKKVETLEDGKFILTFDNKIPVDMIAFIKQYGGDSIELRSSKSIEISEEDLLALTETMLHPEAQNRLQHDTNYLNPNELKEISKAYEKGSRSNILQLVDGYNATMSSPLSTQEQKLNAIRETAIILQNHINTDTNKGFAKHVLKKLQFDTQLQLQAMIPLENRPVNLDQAFIAALKLDQVQLFNKVMSEAISQNRVNSQDFRDFLQECIDQEALVTNHVQAVATSQHIEQAGEQLYQALRNPVVLLGNIDEDGLEHVDPLALQEAQLHEQGEVLTQVPMVPPVNPPPTEHQTVETDETTQHTEISINH